MCSAGAITPFEFGTNRFFFHGSFPAYLYTAAETSPYEKGLQNKHMPGHFWNQCYRYKVVLKGKYIFQGILICFQFFMLWCMNEVRLF